MTTMTSETLLESLLPADLPLSMSDTSFSTRRKFWKLLFRSKNNFLGKNDLMIFEVHIEIKTDTAKWSQITICVWFRITGDEINMQVTATWISHKESYSIWSWTLKCGLFIQICKKFKKMQLFMFLCWRDTVWYENSAFL